MLEWMIAAVALCGAVAGFAALYLALRYALQGNAGGALSRRARAPWRSRRDRSRAGIATLPRARIYRRNGERDASAASRRPISGA